jgi:hypothetical protein
VHVCRKTVSVFGRHFTEDNGNVQKARKTPIIVVRGGKPFAAVVPIRNADEETVSLSTNQKFLAIIERSRSRIKKEGGISAKEIRRRLKLGR